MRRPFASLLNRVFNSSTFSKPIRPLNLKTISPFLSQVILNICFPSPAFGRLSPQLDLQLIIYNLAIVNGNGRAGRALNNPAVLNRKTGQVPRTLNCVFYHSALVE